MSFANSEEVDFILSSTSFVKEAAFGIDALSDEVEEFLHLIYMSALGDPRFRKGVVKIANVSVNLRQLDRFGFSA